MENYVMDDYIMSLNETDITGNIRPSAMCAMAMRASMMITDIEGATDRRIQQELGAVWMIARLEYTQSVPIRPDDAIKAVASPAVIDGAGYLRTVNFFRGSENVAACRILFIVVSVADRRIMLPREVAPCWNYVLEKRNVDTIKHFRFPSEAQHAADLTVRGYDCDKNGHLTSRRYIDYVCESSGYWQNGGVLRYISVDFKNECLCGETISISSAASEGRLLLQGKKPDGRIAFTAACEFSPEK